MALDTRYLAEKIKNALVRADASANSIKILERLANEAFQSGRFAIDFNAAERGIEAKIFVFTFAGEEYAITS